MSENLKEIFKLFSVVTQIGFTMVASIFIGLGSGLLLDKFFHTNYIFSLIMIFVGIAAGFVSIYKQISKYMK